MVEYYLLALALIWSLSHVQLAYLSSLDHFLRDITVLSDWMFLLNQQSRSSQAIAEANSHLSQLVLNWYSSDHARLCNNDR